MDGYSIAVMGDQVPYNVYYDVAADQQKQQAESWSMVSDTATKVFAYDTQTLAKCWVSPTYIRGPSLPNSRYIRAGWPTLQQAALVLWILNHQPA